MSLNAISSHNSQIKVGDGGTPEAFVALSEVLDINGPGEKNVFFDATSQEDSDEAVVPGGVTRFDMVTFKINWIPSDPGHVAVRNALRTKNLTNFQQVWSDGTIDAYSAYVESFKPNAPVDGILTADLTLKLTSSIVTT